MSKQQMSSHPPTQIDRVPIDPSAIAEYISFNSCPQFHKYEFDEDVRVEERNKKNWKEAFEPLNLLLAKDGQDFEEDCIDDLEAQHGTLEDHEGIDEWEDSQDELLEILDRAQNLPAGAPPIITAQTRFGKKIEAWPVYGDADILIFWPQEDNNIRIRVLDIKAAYDEKTYQQIQVGVYTILFKKFLKQQGFSDNTTIEGGVWTREDDITGDRPDDFPKFTKLNARESDVRRLLKAEGEFDRWYTTDNDDVNYQLAPKCYGCTYREACYSNAIEEASLAILGLSRGEQDTFNQYGIDTIHDLAKVAYPETDPKPYEYDELEPADDTLFNQLQDEPGIGERLPRYIQKAQSMLSQFEQNSLFARDGKEAAWMVGAGDGNLPEDDPPYDAELPYERRSMIRTYLHIERDHRRDRLAMMSAYVTSSLYEDAGYEPIKVSKLSDPIPDDEQKAEQVEQDLLTTFFDELFHTMRDVGKKMGHPKEAPIHLYFYTHQEKEALVDAVKRNRSLNIAPSVRDLLGLRFAVQQEQDDQPMVSIVQPEIESRKAATSPNPGLLPMVDEFYPQQNFFPNDNWEYTRSDGVDVNLRDAFFLKFFDYRVPYKENGDKVELIPGTGEDADGYYPSRVRQGSHVPLEYIWSAQGKLTDQWINLVEEEFSGRKQSLEPFRWIDARSQIDRIKAEDVTRLGENLAHCLAHIERGFQYRNSNIGEEKRLFTLDNLETYTLGDNHIVRAAREFLDLEHHTQRSEVLSHYGRQPAQRIRSGESIPMVVEEVETNDRGDIEIEGKLLYDAMFGNNSDRVANSCRQKGDDGATSGSWMVANELTRSGEAAGMNKPHQIEQGVPVTVRELDIDGREIKVTAMETLPFDRDYVRKHRLPETDRAEAEGDDFSVLIEPGKLFVLDPRTDDLTAQRALNVLKQSDNNYLAQTLQGMSNGTVTNPETTAFSKSHIEDFKDWTKSNMTYIPNEEQREFMLENTGQFSLLQGPPGTGKTSLAMAPTILSRVYAFARRDRKFAGLVSGESNKAVDELLEDVGDTYQTYLDSDHSDLLNNLKIVRLVSEQPDDPHPLIEYINYSKDMDAVDEVLERLRNQDVRSQQTFGDYDQNVREHLLVFATPSRIYGLMNKLDRTIDDSMSPADWVQMNATFFDMLAVDEASMMRLPSFLLAGAFIHDHAQVLVGGDQRQMPPVATHDWENEDRRIIEERVPYLSALDYLRLLGGQDVDAVYEPEEAVSADADIPMTQLEITYRCHVTVANFLQRHMYAQDGIEYSGFETYTLNQTTPQTEALEHVLDVDLPLVLILHDNDTNQQANPEEAALAGGIVSGVDPQDNTGIVTPHNAQRGVLGSHLPPDTEVDTVERFQGGQRDMIVVSATASDPDFLEAESDFILNPNRLNVAMSRMKKKLVVIASREVFNLVPPEVEKYNRSLLWKGLYEDMDVNGNDPDWEGTIDDFLPKTAAMNLQFDRDTNVQVFTLGPD